MKEYLHSSKNSVEMSNSCDGVSLLLLREVILSRKHYFGWDESCHGGCLVRCK